MATGSGESDTADTRIVGPAKARRVDDESAIDREKSRRVDEDATTGRARPRRDGEAPVTERNLGSASIASGENPRTPRTNGSKTSSIFDLASGVGVSRQVLNAKDAHKQRELEGMRILLASMVFFSFAAIVGTFVFPGTRNDKWLVALASVAIMLGAIPTLVRSLRVDEFRFGPLETANALISSAAIPALTLGLGMCSPVSGVFALGVLFFALSAPTRVAILLYLEIAIGHAIITALALLGVVTTTGIRVTSPTPPVDLVFISFWVEGMYTAALATGLLLSRRWSLTIAELERAVRTASERDALFREVRAELDRAANLLGPGRFSGHDVGSFRLGDVIGRGGMGEVYAAERIEDGGEAAVKVLLRGMLADRDVVARFEREARMVANLRTPYVTEVFEVGGPEAAIPFIAMERLRGADLASALRNKGVLPLREVLPLVTEIAAGLEVAHEAGVVHRDLKPSNLFHAEVDGKRVWKILDFGIAKSTASNEATLTVNQVLGTPQYMAPEQASGVRTLDRRVDVHALTMIIYRAITGRLAWTGDDIAKVLVAVAHEIPPDPKSYVELPDDLVFVLRIGLAKKPEDRFPTVSELAKAFEDALHGRLSPAWREQAKRLIAAEPWGATVAKGE